MRLLQAESGAAAPIRRGSAQRRRGRDTGVRLLLFAAAASSALLTPRLPLSLAVCDFFLAIVLLLGLLDLRRRPVPRRLLSSAAPWLYLILLGSVIGLLGVGLPGWAAVDLAKNAGAFLTLFAAWSLMSSRGRLVALRSGLVVGASWTAFAILTSGAARPAANFYHPNYAAHYLAATIMVVAIAPYRAWIRWAAIAVFVLAIVRTASFGGLGMALIGTGLLTMSKSSSRRGRRGRLTHRLLVLSAATGAVALILAFGTESLEPVALTGARFDRSATTRADLYADVVGLVGAHPFGVGPTGILERRLVIREGVPWESHSDPLGYLVERGPVGLVGLLGFLVLVYRRAGRGSTARPILLVFCLAGVLRETLNFRHLWLVLALAFVTDELSRVSQPRARPRRVPNRQGSVFPPASIPPLEASRRSVAFEPSGRRLSQRDG